MSNNKTTPNLHLGFMTVLESPLGWVGGLLITSRTGRPLEFQCTTPVKASKTQEILFGKTLLPYLKGELIGKTLVQRVNIKPQVIFCEHPDLLDARQHITTPITCLPQTWKPSSSVAQLKFADGFSDDQSEVQNFLKEIPEQADLNEPLRRVFDALSETVRSGAVA